MKSNQEIGLERTDALMVVRHMSGFKDKICLGATFTTENVSQKMLKKILFIFYFIPLESMRTQCKIFSYLFKILTDLD